MNYHLTPPWSVEGGEERRGESHSYLYYTWWEWCQTMVFGKGGERQRRVNVFIDKTGSSRAEDWDRAEAESTLPGPTRAESPADVFDLITSVCPWFGRIERHSHQTVRFINIFFVCHHWSLLCGRLSDLNTCTKWSQNTAENSLIHDEMQPSLDSKEIRTISQHIFTKATNLLWLCRWRNMQKFLLRYQELVRGDKWKRDADSVQLRESFLHWLYWEVPEHTVYLSEKYSRRWRMQHLWMWSINLFFHLGQVPYFLFFDCESFARCTV